MTLISSPNPFCHYEKPPVSRNLVHHRQPASVWPRDFEASRGRLAEDRSGVERFEEAAAEVETAEEDVAEEEAAEEEVAEEEVAEEEPVAEEPAAEAEPAAEVEPAAEELPAKGIQTRAPPLVVMLCSM